MARTIQSPGVELREVDLTLRPVINQGTSVFITGFANQGPVDEVLQPTSISEFEQIYGIPTNAAERYFYHTAKAALQGPSQLKVTRLPYGEGKGEGFNSWRYSALVYPVNAFKTDKVAMTATAVDQLSAGDAFYFLKPVHIELTLEEYEMLLNNNINWTSNMFGQSLFNSQRNTQAYWQDFNDGTYKSFQEPTGPGLMILNKSQIANNNRFEGYYVALTDNANVNPSTPFIGIKGVDAVATSLPAVAEYVSVPSTRLNFPLTATKFGDGTSVSEVMENAATFDISGPNFSDTLTLGVFKLRQSVFSPDVISLDYVLVEKYIGSLDYHRQIASENGGPSNSFFLGTVTENSPNIKVLVNPYISNRYKNTWLDANGKTGLTVRAGSKENFTPISVPGFVDTPSSFFTRVGVPSAIDATVLSTLIEKHEDPCVLSPLGVYTDTIVTNKNIGSLPQKLERAMELVENSDLYPISLIPEAGLGTIYVSVAEQAFRQNLALSACGPYNDTAHIHTLSSFYTTNSDTLNDEGLRIRGNYNAIASVLVNNARNQRKDCLVILDPLRHIFVQGDNNKVINTKKMYGPNAGEAPNPLEAGFSPTNFSQHIYWPLRHQFNLIDSSYACTYGTVAQVIDPSSNRQVWVPFSGFAAGTMANTDANFQPWFAPAGFTRGVLLGVNDLGIYPKQKQRDQLYKVGLNPVPFFPVEGFVIFGQKTLLKKPSAFDRINVRRLFLNLEVATRDTVKYFVFEPNTLFTRTQVVNVLTPIFENAKNTEGLYDYLIICDERNNTPDVIDQNELKVDIYLKPVRSSEFILVSFYATRTSQNFQELVA